MGQRFEHFDMCALVAEANDAGSSPAERLARLTAAFDSFAELHRQERPTSPRDNSSVGWDIAVLVTLVRLVRDASKHPKSGLDEDQMGNVFRSWRRLFVFSQSADTEYPNHVARRRGALAVLNGLISILLMHSNWTQVKVLLQSIEQSESNAKGDPKKGVLGPCGHMTSEVIRLHFHRGRYFLFDEQNCLFAFLALRQAFFLMPPVPSRWCDHEALGGQKDDGDHRDQQPMTLPVYVNKAKVGFYWMVAALLCGLKPTAAGRGGGGDVLASARGNTLWSASVQSHEAATPSPASLMSRYLNAVFGPLVAAVDAGDEYALWRALMMRKKEEDAKNPASLRLADVFLVKGVFVLMQQLRSLCLLVLVKRVSLAFAAIDAASGGGGGDGSRVPLGAIAHCLSKLAARHAETLSSANAAGSPPPLPGVAAGGGGGGESDASANNADAAASSAMWSFAWAPPPGDAVDDVGSGLLGAFSRDPCSVVPTAEHVGLRIAGLIQRGWIKGYLSHPHRMLVLSKKDPFPLSEGVARIIGG